MRLKFKLAIIESGLKHQRLAEEANAHLPAEQCLSELNITQIVTERRKPTPLQASALACVLGREVVDLFPPEGSAT